MSIYQSALDLNLNILISEANAAAHVTQGKFLHHSHPVSVSHCTLLYFQIDKDGSFTNIGYSFYGARAFQGLGSLAAGAEVDLMLDIRLLISTNSVLFRRIVVSC